MSTRLFIVESFEGIQEAILVLYVNIVKPNEVEDIFPAPELLFP